MRRHVFATLSLLLLALIESALLPPVLGGLPRPNLVLIAAGTWAAMRRNEGFVWALGGGILLDLASSVPFGAHAVGLIFGNLIALALDRFPMPAPFFRITNWVAISTLVFHLVLLLALSVTGRGIPLGLALSTNILPLLAINPVLSLLAFVLLAPIQNQLNEQEKFAT
jgi:rod shape-determining protein MreD